MPGKLVRVLVSAGQDVGAGQGLVVMEAMKMENELRAPRAGRVLGSAGARGPGGRDRRPPRPSWSEPPARAPVPAMKRRSVVLVVLLAGPGRRRPARAGLDGARPFRRVSRASSTGPSPWGACATTWCRWRWRSRTCASAGPPRTPSPSWKCRVSPSRPSLRRPVRPSRRADARRGRASPHPGPRVPAGWRRHPANHPGRARRARSQIRRLIVAGASSSSTTSACPSTWTCPTSGGRLNRAGRACSRARSPSGPVPLRFGSAPPLSLRTQIELALEGSNVTIESGTLTGDRTDLTYRGRVAPLPAAARSWGSRARWTSRYWTVTCCASDLGLEGHGQFRGTVRLDQGRVRVSGRLDGTAGLVRRRRRAALRGRRPLGREGHPRARPGGHAARRVRDVRDRGAAETRPGPRGRAARRHRCGGRGAATCSASARPGWGQGRRVRSPCAGLGVGGKPSAAVRPWTSRPARTGARLSAAASCGAPRRAPSSSKMRSCRRRPRRPISRAPSPSIARPTSRWRRAARTSRPRTRSSCASAAPWARTGQRPWASPAPASSRAAGAARLDAPVFEGRFTGRRRRLPGRALGPRGVGGRLRRARGAAAFARPPPSGRRALGGRPRADGRPRGRRRDRCARPHRELARARPRDRAGLGRRRAGARLRRGHAHRAPQRRARHRRTSPAAPAATTACPTRTWTCARCSTAA